MRYFANLSSFFSGSLLLLFTFLTLYKIVEFNSFYLFIASIVLIVASYFAYKPIKPDTQDEENLRMYGVFSFILGAICFTLLSLVYLNDLIIKL